MLCQKCNQRACVETREQTRTRNSVSTAVLQRQQFFAAGVCSSPLDSTLLTALIVGVQVEENSWVLHQTVLRLSGGELDSSLSIDAVLAPFSPPPADTVLGPVVLSVPPMADRGLENEADVRGRWVCMVREIARAMWGRVMVGCCVGSVPPSCCELVFVLFEREQPEADTVGGCVQVGVIFYVLSSLSFALSLLCSRSTKKPKKNSTVRQHSSTYAEARRSSVSSCVVRVHFVSSVLPYRP